MSKLDKEKNRYCTAENLVNAWLSENPDREIERIDYPDGGNDLGSVMVVWHRKIDPNFRNNRGPEA